MPSNDRKKDSKAAGKELRGKVCLITGGSGLLGSAFVRVCAENGAIVIAADLRKPAALPAGAVFVPCDITDRKSIKRCVSGIVKKYGRLDILVNNAYPRTKGYGRRFEEISYADFAENLSMHAAGYCAVSQEAAAVMKKQKGGSIVFMGSIYGSHAPRFDIYEGTKMTMPFEYAAIKGAVISMMRYLAVYLGPSGIRVNSLSPGGVFNGQDKRFVERYKKHVKLVPARMATPEDIAQALLFLISDRSAYMTGHDLVIDGGWTL